MLSVTIGDEPVKSKYPYIGIHSESKRIVLFVGEKTGMCLVPGTIDYPVGDYSCTWNEPDFEPYEGSIILKNL